MLNNNDNDNPSDHRPIPPELLPLMEARVKSMSKWLFGVCESNPLHSDTLNIKISVEFKDGLVLECSMLDIESVISGRTVITEDKILQPPIIVKRKKGEFC